MFFVALVLKVHDCASWSGLLSWLDFYCGRSPSPVIKPSMHGFCVSAGLGPSICAAHVSRSLLSEVSIVATPAGKPGFFLHAWRPRLGCFMPGSRARSPPPDSLEHLLSEPRVCVCSCIVRCAQQRDGKMHRETTEQIHLPVYTHTYIRACRRAGALPSPVFFLARFQLLFS